MKRSIRLVTWLLVAAVVSGGIALPAAATSSSLTPDRSPIPANVGSNYSLPNFTSQDGLGTRYQANAAVWTSSDPGVAAVSGNVGTTYFTAVSIGDATLTATYPDGSVGTVIAQVRDAGGLPLTPKLTYDKKNRPHLKKITAQLIDETTSNSPVSGALLRIVVVYTATPDQFTPLCSATTNTKGKITCTGDTSKPINNVVVYYDGGPVVGAAQNSLIS